MAKLERIGFASLAGFMFGMILGGTTWALLRLLRTFGERCRYYDSGAATVILI